MANETRVILEGDRAYTSFIEPFMNHACSAEKVDWTAWREKLAAPDGSDLAEGGRMRIDDVSVHPGSLSIAGGLEVNDGGILVVLGDLQVRGGVVAASPDYVAIVVRGQLDVDRLYVTGDVVVFGGIDAEVWWGVGNDYATCTPTLKARTYISQDRGDIIDTCTARRKLEGSELQQHFSELDPKSDDSIADFIGLVRVAPPVMRCSEPGERASLEAQLKAGWALPERRNRIKAVRAVYAIIKRRRLADVGGLLVDMIERKAVSGEDWSIQDELHLLADLRRADLLEALPPEWLRGYAGWIPNLLVKARG